MIVQDITERKRTERGLIESEKRFRLFVENAPDGVFVEMDGIFAYVNRMTVELFGVSSEHELLGNPIHPFFSDASQKKMAARFRRLRVRKKPMEMIRETIIQPNGGHLEVEISAVPFQLGGEDGALVFLHDITVRKQLEAEKLHMEAQLRHKQKLESIGILAGGVAHEINNPVSGIINYAQLITESQGAGADVVEFGGEIIKEGHRIADIVKNLLKFARQEKQSHSPAQVNDIINETLLLIRTIIRTDKIALDVALAPDLPSVKCRSQQIQQVLMNLITNARDALNARYKEEHEDKRIMLSSSFFVRQDGSEWVRITVEDHGMGIPDDVKEKMFDPFFTTKSRNEGTGLGLSISHGIVQDHHGALYFETELGQYTRAILELPVNNGWELTGKAEE
jgi:PAS domain S-box-containing protein